MHTQQCTYITHTDLHTQPATQINAPVNATIINSLPLSSRVGWKSLSGNRYSVPSVPKALRHLLISMSVGLGHWS